MLGRKRYHKTTRSDSIAQLPRRTQVVLYVVAAALLLVLLRTWHLAVISHDDKLEEASKPQKKIVIEPSKRGTIRDRFNHPLAINKIQYQAAIVYSQILQIPPIRWEQQPDGTRIKHYKRREYIRSLSETLAQELDLNPDRIEDLIHSKAALYHHVPFQIKNNLTEKEYYRLKLLEKDWVGLNVQRQPLRHYPQGPLAADIIGYMGAINRQEYEKVLSEIRALEEIVQLKEEGEEPPLPEGVNSINDILAKLKDLQDKAYTINDFVGKMGIEGKYEQILRGFHGQKTYTTDARGNFVRELPGAREPLPGQRLLLSFSAELQNYAEELLIINEQIRQARVSSTGSLDRSIVAEKQPWIKGGAIVALDPNTGDVLALASYPRYNPNDFVAPGKARKNVLKWFETETYLAEVWEQKQPLQRETYNKRSKKVEEETLWMTWDNYLNFILPLEGPLRQSMETIATIKDAIQVQKDPSIARQLKNLQSDYDKTLLTDISRLVVFEEKFDNELLSVCGNISLSDHHDHACALAQLQEILKDHVRKLFHNTTFAQWRKTQEKEFLAQKRTEEKQKKRYAKPYIDLLDNEERTQFNAFWDNISQEILAAYLIGEWGATEADDTINDYLDYYQNKPDSITLEEPCKELCHKLKNTLSTLSPAHAYAYLGTLRSFNQLQRPLLGKYRPVRKEQGLQLEKHLAIAFYPMYGYGYGRSHAYRQATTQGSIFKLVTAYAGLIHQYLQNPNGDLNPLTIRDAWKREGSQVTVAYAEDGKPIPQLYKGGRLPKSLAKNIGITDIIKALAYSSNPYFSLLAGDILSSPEELAEAARLFSYGSPTGIDLPAEIGGHIPSDLSINRTGLYAMAIGQHSLVVTPLQSAVMLCALANGGKILQPKLVYMTAGRKTLRSSNLDQNLRFAYQDLLKYVGIDFPLFTQPTDKEHHVQAISSTIRHEAFMPRTVQQILLEGMRQVVIKSQQTSIKPLKRLYRNFPEAIKDYEDIGIELLGKTSTAESVEAIDLELPPKSRIYNHLWYGGILFHPEEKSYLFSDRFGKSELVVVVYLRYGGYGKDTAPVAAQIAQRWRQIKAKNLLIKK